MEKDTVIVGVTEELMSTKITPCIDFIIEMQVKTLTLCLGYKL